MASQANAKKQTSKNKSNAKGAVAGPKKVSLSRAQLAILVASTVVVAGAVTYVGVQYSQNTTTNAASCVSKTLEKGDSGRCVKILQYALRSTMQKQKVVAPNSSYVKAVKKLPTLTASGTFDNATKTVVETFQKYASVSKSASDSTKTALTVNGVVNKRTWAGICKFAGSPDPSSNEDYSYSDASCVELKAFSAKLK